MHATLIQTRFGDIDVPAEHVIEFPSGIIGIEGRRYTLLRLDDGPFLWLQSIDDPAIALPVCNPWRFFPEAEVVLSDGDRERLAVDEAEDDPEVWVTVRPADEPQTLTANLRAPIVISGNRGFQVINEAADAALRAPIPRGSGTPQAA